jgi:hypothetical protein
MPAAATKDIDELVEQLPEIWTLATAVADAHKHENASGRAAEGLPGVSLVARLTVKHE